MTQVINKRLFTSQRTIQGQSVHTSLDFLKTGKMRGFWHGKNKRRLCATPEYSALLVNPGWILTGMPAVTYILTEQLVLHMGNTTKAGTKSYHHDKPLGVLLRELNPHREMDEVGGRDLFFFFFLLLDSQRNPLCHIKL